MSEVLHLLQDRLLHAAGARLGRVSIAPDEVFGVGMIAGIGFTISLLITSLAFEEQALVDEAKLGVLAGSTVAGIAGLVFLFFASRPPKSEPTLVE